LNTGGDVGDGVIVGVGVTGGVVPMVDVGVGVLVGVIVGVTKGESIVKLQSLPIIKKLTLYNPYV
jgi:hypothetical protein